MKQPRCLIIGGGLAGCSVAYHARRSSRVTLFEQADRLGAEASSQNAGMIRRLGEDPYERALAIRTWDALEHVSGGESGLALSRRTGAWIGLKHDPHHLHDAVAHLRARGVKVEAVDVRSTVPPLSQGADWAGAWWLPDERVVHGPTLVEFFARRARDHGADLHTGVQVMELQVEAGRCVGVRTEDGEMRADRVVLAGGAWCSALAARAGLQRPLMPVRRSVFRTVKDDRATDHHPWVWVDDEGVYARAYRGTWLVSPCDERLCWPARGPGSMGEPVKEAEEWLAHKLKGCLPSLAGMKWSEAWSGLRTFAPDRRPVLGEDPDLPGLWWAAGLGGFGVSCGWAVGETLASWMDGDEVPWVDPNGVSPGRHFPDWWPVRVDGRIQDARLVKASTSAVGY